MPNIHSYAPDPGTFRPSPEGISAWETAGRRLGPMYREAAEEILKTASLKERTLKQNLWPWNILELEARLKEGKSLSIRVRGDKSSLSLRDRPEDMREHNQINKGGAIFADAVDKMIGEAPAIEKGKMIDAKTGQVLSNDPSVTVLFPGANDWFALPKIGKLSGYGEMAGGLTKGIMSGDPSTGGLIVQPGIVGAPGSIYDPDSAHLYPPSVQKEMQKSPARIGLPEEVYQDISGQESEVGWQNLGTGGNLPMEANPWASGEGGVWDWMANALGTVSEAVGEANSAIGSAVENFFSSSSPKEEVQY